MYIYSLTPNEVLEYGNKKYIWCIHFKKVCGSCIYDNIWTQY